MSDLTWNEWHYAQAAHFVHDDQPIAFYITDLTVGETTKGELVVAAGRFGKMIRTFNSVDEAKRRADIWAGYPNILITKLELAQKEER